METAARLDIVTTETGSTDPAGVRRYIDHIRAGGAIAPLTVILNNEDGKYYVVDGHHRLEAFDAAGVCDFIPIEHITTIDHISELASTADIFGFSIRD